MRVPQLLPPATTCVPPCTKGAAATTPSISRRIASASSSVSVEAAPAPSRAPPCVTLPGVTMARFAPSERICRSTRLRAPEPIATMAITAATPMTMPSMVSRLRRAFAMMAESAERMASINLMRRPPRPRSRASSGRLALILDDAAVPEAHEAAGMAAHIGVVRHEHDGDALAVQLLEQAQDLVRGAAVEGAGRLVGEQQARAVHERPRDRDALLLAAGQLHRAMMGAVREADAAERLQGPLAAGPAVDAGIDHRQFDIAEGIDARQQIELLEHEADLAVAQAREAVGIEALDGRAGEPVLAARSAGRGSRSGS